MPNAGKEWRDVAEVDSDGQGGSVANYASPGQEELLRERFRKLGAKAAGETGPNVKLSPDEARITANCIDRQ